MQLAMARMGAQPLNQVRRVHYDSRGVKKVRGKPDIQLGFTKVEEEASVLKEHSNHRL